VEAKENKVYIPLNSSYRDEGETGMTVDEMYGLLQTGLLVLSFIIMVLIFIRLSYEREEKSGGSGA